MMDVTGTIAICLIAGILIAAAWACKLGKRHLPPVGASDAPPPDPTNGFRDPYR